MIDHIQFVIFAQSILLLLTDNFANITFKTSSSLLNFMLYKLVSWACSSFAQAVVFIRSNTGRSICAENDIFKFNDWQSWCKEESKLNYGMQVMIDMCNSTLYLT